MGDCNRKDLSELLMRALSPKDRPEDVPGLKDHVRECPQCAMELELYSNFLSFVQENREELATALSECPDAVALVQFVAEGMTDPEIGRHIDSCYQCQDELGLVEELIASRLDTDQVPARLTVAQWGLVRDRVAKEYGVPAKEEPSLLHRFLGLKTAFLNIPSLAVGALAAALVLLVVLPRPGEQPFNVELSDVNWAQKKRGVG